MAVKKLKPTTPGQRFRVVSMFETITTDRPEKSLLAPKKRSGGRNATGRMTIIAGTRTYDFYLGNWAAGASSTATGSLTDSGSIITFLTATQTARVEIVAAGQGADNVNVGALAPGETTYFTGALIH